MKTSSLIVSALSKQSWSFPFVFEDPDIGKFTARQAEDGITWLWESTDGTELKEEISDKGQTLGIPSFRNCLNSLAEKCPDKALLLREVWQLLHVFE